MSYNIAYTKYYARWWDPTQHIHTQTHRLSLEKEYSDNEEFERKIHKLQTIHFTNEEYELICLIFYFSLIFNIVHIYCHTYLGSML